MTFDYTQLGEEAKRFFNGLTKKDQAAVKFGAMGLRRQDSHFFVEVLLQPNPNWNSDWEGRKKSVKVGGRFKTISKYLPTKMYEFERWWKEEERQSSIRQISLEDVIKTFGGEMEPL